MPASPPDLVIARPEGLYCPAGDFHIDPWRPVDRAVITHAHGDHARGGHAHYLAAEAAGPVMRARLGDVRLQTLPYGETLSHHGVQVSLHPAGHVLGSAQVRLAHDGRVWVVSGDYFVAGEHHDPREHNRTCAPFEPVRCHCFVTESTFGLPIYRWAAQESTFAGIDAWWRANAQEGRPSILYAYALGKAQRVLDGVDASIGPIVVHGAVDTVTRAYRAAGVRLPATVQVSEVGDAARLRQSLVIAPPSAQRSPWLRRFGEHSDAFASGWMQVRGARRRRAVDRGFVLSDHADWPGLHRAIVATGATRVIVTHGFEQAMVRHLRERGYDAGSFATEYGDRDDDDDLPGAAP
jgi:putative mRNA 3-end processing factor